MRVWALCFLWVCAASAGHALAVYTDEPGSDELFSEAFRTALSEIDRMDGAKEEAGLLVMLEKFKQPHEQLEIRYQLAMLYNQRTGMVCHEKAVVYFEDVLASGLPPRAAALARILCGDSWRIMKDYAKALDQYLKGLALCLEQDLPDAPPEVAAVGKGHRRGQGPKAADAEVEAELAEKVKAAAQAKFERQMIDYKDTLVRQIVTLYDKIPFDEGELRELAKPIIRDGVAIDRLVHKVKAHLEGKERERQDNDSES